MITLGVGLACEASGQLQVGYLRDCVGETDDAYCRLLAHPPRRPRQE